MRYQKYVLRGVQLYLQHHKAVGDRSLNNVPRTCVRNPIFSPQITEYCYIKQRIISGPRMNKRLISLGPYLVPLSAVGGGLIIVLLVALVGRIFRSCRRPRLLGTVHPTPRYISNWLPLATPRPHIPPAMPTDQVGDANDGVTSSTTFSLDGREESLILPPPAATQPGKKARSILGDHGPSTLAIHMDGAER